MTTLNIQLMTTANGKNATSFLEEKLREFKEKENVEVKIKFVSWNRAYKDIIKGFKENTSPDILQLGSTWVRTMAHLGYIGQIPPSINIPTPLTNWVKDSCEYQNLRVAVPWIIDTVIMAARQDILDKMGINPEDIRDWDGFYNICRRLTKLRVNNKSLPKALAFSIRPGMDTVHRFSAWVFAQGKQYPEFYSAPNSILTSGDFQEVFKYLSRLIKTCRISLEDVDKHPYQINDDFYKHGQYVFCVGNWNGIVADILNRPFTLNKNHKYNIFPIPSNSPESRTYGGGSVLAVSSKTTNPEKALRLIEYMVSNKFANNWLEFTGGVPAFETDFWKKRFSDERIDTMYKMTINSDSYPLHPAWVSIENLLRIGISNYFWQLIEEDSHFSKNGIFYILQQTDISIQEILRMSWELNNYD